MNFDLGLALKIIGVLILATIAGIYIWLNLEAIKGLDPWSFLATNGVAIILGLAIFAGVLVAWNYFMREKPFDAVQANYEAVTGALQLSQYQDSGARLYCVGGKGMAKRDYGEILDWVRCPAPHDRLWDPASGDWEDEKAWKARLARLEKEQRDELLFIRFRKQDHPLWRLPVFKTFCKKEVLCAFPADITTPDEVMGDVEVKDYGIGKIGEAFYYPLSHRKFGANSVGSEFMQSAPYSAHYMLKLLGKQAPNALEGRVDWQAFKGLATENIDVSTPTIQPAQPGTQGVVK